MTVTKSTNGTLVVVLTNSDVASLAWDMRECIEGSGIFEDAPDAPITQLARAVGACK